jgi:hypothetical protein
MFQGWNVDDQEVLPAQALQPFRGIHEGFGEGIGGRGDILSAEVFALGSARPFSE